MEIKEFNSWLAYYLQQNEDEVIKLLEDKTATQFLITWSLLELACFQGYARFDNLDKFATQKSTDKNLTLSKLDEFIHFFHNRYQNDEYYKRLMHDKICEKMKMLRKKDFSEFSPSEKIYFAMVVIYRYRNNIFHGNKGVDSWLQYKTCILYCIGMMQLLISIPENGLHDN